MNANASIRLTWFHLGTPYDLVNNIVGSIQPVTALSTQKDQQNLWCLAQLLTLSAVFFLTVPAKSLRNSLIFFLS